MVDIEFYEEPLSPTYHQLDDLMHEDHARTLLEDGFPRLRVNWPAYIRLNLAGDLHLFTARDQKFGMYGFALYHVHEHPHHMGINNASCVALVTRRDMRGKGIARMLMEYAEPRLHSRGVDFITHQFRTRYGAEPLFPKLGYKLVEQTYVKDIR